MQSEAAAAIGAAYWGSSQLPHCGLSGITPSFQERRFRDRGEKAAAPCGRKFLGDAHEPKPTSRKLYSYPGPKGISLSVAEMTLLRRLRCLGSFAISISCLRYQPICLHHKALRSPCSKWLVLNERNHPNTLFQKEWIIDQAVC